MPAVSPSGLENALEPWLTKQVGGLSRLLPHPRPALNDTFSIPTAAGLPRQVKQGKRQRSDTRKQSVHLKWRRATPLLRATGRPRPAARLESVGTGGLDSAACPAPGSSTLTGKRRGREPRRQEPGGKWDLPAGKSEESRIARRRTSETANAAAPKKV